jgi:hypothetical protein
LERVEQAGRMRIPRKITRVWAAMNFKEVEQEEEEEEEADQEEEEEQD